MIVAKTGADFNSLEKEIFKKCCKLGCDVLKAILESYDGDIALTRDKEKYRHKGKRKTVIKTVMGEVEYCRVVYETEESDGNKMFVYLLDEAMGIDGNGYMSGLLSELIAQAVCESPYRSAARSVSDSTGQRISHTAAWAVAQKLGERVEQREKQAAAAAAKGDGAGTLESRVLSDTICAEQATR